MCLTTVCDGNSEFYEVEGKVNYTPEVHVNFKIYIRKYLNKLKLSLIIGKHDSLPPKNTTS